MERFPTIYVGSDSGHLIGVKPNSETKINILNNCKKQKAISSLNYCEDGTKKTILIGNRDNTLTSFDVERQSVESTTSFKSGSGRILGTFQFAQNSKLFCVNENGFVFDTNVEESLFKTADNLESILVLPDNRLAVAGKLCQVAIFDVERQKQVWKAKNPPNDALNLAIPIWISGMCYQDDLICTASRHGVVSSYDRRQGNKPVLNWIDETYSFTTISSSFKSRNCLLGTNKGFVRLFEFRKTTIANLNSYKGSVGTVTDIYCSPKTAPYLFVTSLDRNLNVFNLNTKELISQFYMRIRLRKMLIIDSDVLPEKMQTENEDAVATDEDDDDDDDDEEEVEVEDDKSESESEREERPSKRIRLSRIYA